MRHEAFESSYRRGFEVVEQRQGKVHFYPHTEQLPILLRALRFEFRGGLPDRLARIDHRADGFHKIILNMASTMFCGAINGTRPDQLHLFNLPDRDLVCHPTIVQHITEYHRLGLRHSFRFYGGENFFPEIYFCGKRVIFSDHVLARFNARVPGRVGDDLNTLLNVFFGCHVFAMECGPGFAFVLQHDRSVLAFPFDETDDEFFLKSCLTIHEISQLGYHMPPYTINCHYDLPYQPPEVRNWFPIKGQIDLYNAWRNKGPLPEDKMRSVAKKKWSYIGHWVKGYVEELGHGPGSQIRFIDDLPGPGTLTLRPNQVWPEHREEADYKEYMPEFDWDEAYARRRAEKRIGENEVRR